jgi:hypothetical protein
MSDDDTLIESVKFLLTSVKQLSDRFLESESRLKRGFDGVATDISDLLERVDQIEKDLVQFRDDSLLPQRTAPAPRLPVQEGTENHPVPAINLSLADVLDAYANTPILLEPFCRPCAVTGRTLSGEIEEVELEMFNQGTTWSLELLEGGWILLPRPGSLERRVQIQSLERLFEVEGVSALPATLHLLNPATAVAVEYGRRWQLEQKGRLSIHPDPLRQGTGTRLQAVEDRLSRLEDRLLRDR